MKKLLILILLLTSYVGLFGQANLSYVKSYDSTFSVLDSNKDTLWTTTTSGDMIFYINNQPFDTVAKTYFTSMIGAYLSLQTLNLGGTELTGAKPFNEVKVDSSRVSDTAIFALNGGGSGVSDSTWDEATVNDVLYVKTIENTNGNDIKIQPVGNLYFQPGGGLTVLALNGNITLLANNSSGGATLSLDGNRASISSDSLLTISADDEIRHKVLGGRIRHIGDTVYADASDDGSDSDLIHYKIKSMSLNGTKLLGAKSIDDKIQTTVWDSLEVKKFKRQYRSITANSGYTSGDFLVISEASSAITYTLPEAAISTGVTLRFINNANSVNFTIDGNLSETISGNATVGINTQYQTVTLDCDGSEWFISSSYTP